MTRADRLAAALLAAVLAAASSGCAKARAHATPELPPLAVPAPPARTLPPLEGGPIEAAVPAAPQPPPPARPAARPRSEPRNGDALARADAAADAARVDVPPDAPRPAEEPAAAPTLRLMPGGELPASEDRVRQQIVRAQQDLNNVDYKALNADAREQYDTAKRFVAVAEQAIKDRNLIFAQTLADKAATIAAVLLRR